VHVTLILPELEVEVTVFPSTSFKSLPQASNVVDVVCDIPAPVQVVFVVHVLHFSQLTNPIINKIKNRNSNFFIFTNFRLIKVMNFPRIRLKQ
jgi:hypothetical protein